MNFYFVNIFQLPFNAYTQSLFLLVNWVGYSSHKVRTAGLKGLGLNPHWGERIESYGAFFHPGV